MRTAEETFGPLTGDEHPRVEWLGRHEEQTREMKCGCELHALLSQVQVPQECQPSQGSSSGHRALSTPWQPGIQMLVTGFAFHTFTFLWINVLINCEDEIVIPPCKYS